MKKLFGAAALAALVISSTSAYATVEPIDWNNDGLNFHLYGNKYRQQQTFLDRANGLLWTNANFTQSPTRPIAFTYDEANAFLAQTFNTSTNLNVWNNEGLHNWRIPTKAEFEKLIATQGVHNQVIMNLEPFTPGHSYVWTSTTTTTTSPISGQPAHWGFAPNDGSFKVFADIIPYSTNLRMLDIWAVAPVPEPETYAMLLAGLGVMGVVARRRQNKQA